MQALGPLLITQPHMPPSIHHSGPGRSELPPRQDRLILYLGATQASSHVRLLAAGTVLAATLEQSLAGRAKN